MYIGEIIKKYRIENKLSQRAFARRTSLSPSYINTLEKIYNPMTCKPYSVTTDVALEIANAMSINIEDLLNILNKDKEEDSYYSKHGLLTSQISFIPILKNVKQDNDSIDKDDIIGIIDIPKELAGKGSFFALKIKDDSMAPAIIQDDIVIIKKQDNFENGDIVVVINNDQPILRKGKHLDTGILLQPFNNSYEPLFLTNIDAKSMPLAILGVVKKLERQF